MSVQQNYFSQNFTTRPYWWEDFEPPQATPSASLPKTVDVLVIGAGYAGVSCAYTLAKAGTNVLVLDSDALGAGASSRSGGQITGGVNIGKNPTGKNALANASALARRDAMLTECADGMRYVEDLIEQHKIDCGYHKTGRFTGFWMPEHAAKWEADIDDLNRLTGAGAFMVSRAQMAEEIGSTRYHGGVVIGNAGHLQPAVYYGGLLRAAQEAGAILYGNTSVLRVAGAPGGFTVTTERGEVRASNVVLATNGYPSGVSGRLRRQVIPITSHMIATEELPAGLAQELMPKNRAVAETRRVINHYRLSPDGKRMLFGGRARFVKTDEKTTALLLRRQLVDRFPQLRDVKITHSWGGNVAMTFDFLPHIGQHEGMHYALGCNGSGVVMMTYLGHRVAQKLLDPTASPSAYDAKTMPEHPLYRGGEPWFMSIVGSWYQFLDVIDRRRATRGAK